MQQFAVSSGVAIVYVIVLWVVLFVAPLTITALKGQWAFFIAGWIIVGIVWWIAALRLARPGSWWARRLYGPDKLARVQSRYRATTSDSALT